jgi:peptidyl-prolyl cis-trans isomerase SurA
MTGAARAIGAALTGALLLVLTAGSALAVTKVTVNGIPISDIAISQRVKLIQLEGHGGTKEATASLIDEQIQLQEARRLGIDITDAQIQSAFAQVATNVKLSTDKLKQLLTARGVGMDTLDQRLKAALAWKQVLLIAVKPRVTISDLDLDKEAAAKMDPTMNFDYILKEVLFVMAPGDGAASKRTADANQYRKNYKGCDSAVKLTLSYTDAAVVDVGRRHATQLPEAIAKELAKLNVGGISKPRVVANGVSMLAVCAKTEAVDLTFIKSGLRQQQGNEAYQAEADKYLAELRQKANIVYN